jgi:hypothetical protein
LHPNPLQPKEEHMYKPLHTDQQVLDRIKDYADNKEITIYQNDGSILVDCVIKSAFRSKKHHDNLKAYLRNNAFLSDGMGSYTRYSKPKPQINISGMLKQYEKDIKANLLKKLIQMAEEQKDNKLFPQEHAYHIEHLKMALKAVEGGVF